MKNKKHHASTTFTAETKFDPESINAKHIRELQHEIALNDKIRRSLTVDCWILGLMFVITLIAACKVVHDANQANVRFEERVSKLENAAPTPRLMQDVVKSDPFSDAEKSMPPLMNSIPAITQKQLDNYFRRQLIHHGIIESGGDY